MIKRTGTTVLRFLGIFLLLGTLLEMILFFQVKADSAARAEDQERMQKSEEALLGERFTLPFGPEGQLEVNFYAGPEKGKALPLVLNLHGGSFHSGDADTLDSQSFRLAEQWNVHVAAVDYPLLEDDVTQSDATRAVTDAVTYFRTHSEEYRVDPDRVYLMGFSAGGYYAMASAIALQTKGAPAQGQILCYAWLGDILEQFRKLPDPVKENLPPALFLFAKGDSVGKGTLKYEDALRTVGVPTQILEYDGVRHGFLEENNPEYDQLHPINRTSQSPEGERAARDAETKIGAWIQAN